MPSRDQSVRWLKTVTGAVGAVMLIAGPANALDIKPSAVRSAEPLKLVISRDDQRINVYRGLELILSSPVSTGKTGYATPLGVYSILGKRKWHRSNIYSRAPMPFMQRITWSGIALHEGRVPDYPASHGCIRLPKGFATELFAMTEIGADVIITSSQARPMSVSHSMLIQPSHPVSALAVHDTGGNGGTAVRSANGVGLADVEYAVYRMQAHRDRSTSPLRILITLRTGRQRMMDVQRMLLELGHDPGEIDGYLGGNTGGAVQSFQRASELPATGMVTDELVSALYRAVRRDEVKGHIYVRQDYVDLFDAPVAITDIDRPLGTHVYSLRQRDDGSPAAWTALTVDNADGETYRQALDRIRIPDSIRNRISELLTSGSSLVISDAGLGRETGKGTDFIVQPK